MKKFSAIAAAVFITGGSLLAADASPVKESRTPDAMPVSALLNANHGAAVRGRRAVNEAEWKLLGETTWTDQILFVAYNMDIHLETTVNVYQNKTNSNQYLFTDLYPQSMIDEQANYMVNPIYRRIDPNGESTMTLTVDPDKGNVTADFYFNVTDGETLSLGQLKYGTFNNNTFWFEKDAFILLYDDAGYGNTPAFHITLPGAKDLSLKAEALTPLCTDDNKLTYSIECGADATAKILLANGIYQASRTNLAAVAEDGEDVTDGTYTLQCQPGWNTLLAVSLAADGSVGNGIAIYHYGTEHNDDEWINLGQTTFSDDTFTNIYSFDGNVEPYKVTLLEKADNPEVIRVVSPYENNPYIASREDVKSHEGHGHYMTFDISDPMSVKLEFAPVGVDFGGDECWSLQAQVPGTMKDGELSFEQYGLAVYNRTMTGYTVNHHSRFIVEVPNHVTVTVTDENGEPLEGVTVEAVGSGSEGALTDAEGVAHLGAPVGTMIYTLDKEGYKPVMFTAEGTGRQLSANPTMEKQNVGIEEVTISKADFRNAYDLAGRKINHPANGIMIFSGKKVIK